MTNGTDPLRKREAERRWKVGWRRGAGEELQIDRQGRRQRYTAPNEAL